MAERPVDMGMAMRLPEQSSRRVGVLMVLIMDMRVRVFEYLVLVLVFVPLSEVQPYASPHEGRGEEGLPGQRLMECDGACDCSHEGCGREIRAGARGAEETEGEHE